MTLDLVRAMQPGDAADVLGMMKELSAFERKTDFRISESDLAQWRSRELYPFDVLVAQTNGPATAAPPLIGYAAYYMVPFKDDVHPALMLKGLYVRPEHRGQGVGRHLFEHIAQIARDRNCGRLQWFVLRDNKNAKAFYQECGAAPDLIWERWGLDLNRAI